jgi:GntR family transcriptional repressor for pyruvate dehydrogenase complex
MTGHQKLPHRVADQVIGLIENGHLEPGARLPGERKLCETCGVGRSALREALRILEQRGLIEVRQGRGMFVAGRGLPAVLATISEQLQREELTFAEVLESRRHLETHIVGLAAQRRTDEDLQAMLATQMAMQAAIEDAKAFLELDLRFHGEVARASGNRLNELWLQPIMQVLITTRRSIVALRPVRKRVLDCHAAIFGAIQEGHAEHAQEALHQHLEQFVADTDLARTLGLL